MTPLETKEYYKTRAHRSARALQTYVWKDDAPVREVVEDDLADLVLSEDEYLVTDPAVFAIGIVAKQEDDTNSVVIIEDKPWEENSIVATWFRDRAEVDALIDQLNAAADKAYGPR